MVITLTDEQVESCYEFAAKRLGDSNSLYKKRGGGKPSKIEEDLIVGAKAELAVYEFLRKQPIISSAPDFAIYKKREKSFKADLVSGSYNLHIKAQSIDSAKKYGASWLFQKEDKLFSAKQANDLLFFCIVNGTEVELKSIASVPEIVDENLLAEPKLYQMKFTKVALYLDQILNKYTNGVQKWTQVLQMQTAL